MYRANDPRFRRRLNELGQTLENANESAQSNIYIFTQTYIKPCLSGVTAGVTACVDASCPTLNVRSRDRLRRQRGRTRAHAELNFDFYDDWEEEENDALLGWGGDEDLDRMLAAAGGSYGTVTNTQPARQRGMSYPRGRWKGGGGSGVPPLDAADADATVIPGSGGFFGKLFGGKALRYKPSAAGLQEHPNIRRSQRRPTEGEALLEEHSYGGRGKGRMRSGTTGSGHTTDSRSSRGDILPSDGEDDAVPLDDEFAMVLERRITPSGAQDDGGPAQYFEGGGDRKHGKHSYAGSRASTGRRTFSTRSRKSTNSEPQTPVDDAPPPPPSPLPLPPGSEEMRQSASGMTEEVKGETRRPDAPMGEHAELADDAAHLRIAEDGLAGSQGDELSSKEATPQATSPARASSPTTAMRELDLDAIEHRSTDASPP